MKQVNKLMSIVIAVILCFSMCVTASAETLGATFTASLDENELPVSNSAQTVTLTISPRSAITADGFGMELYCSEGLKITAIKNETLGFTAADYNIPSETSAKVSWSSSDAENTNVELLVVMEVTVPANTAAGTYQIGYKELQVTHAYGEEYDDAKALADVVTLTLTAPHVHQWSTDWTNDGTHHWHKCMAEGCDITDNAQKDGYAAHSGGNATCTDKATCEVCHQPYGNLADHSFIKKDMNNNTLKSAGTCTTEAVYYYTCANCSEVSTTLTFTGEKNPTKHEGTLGTEWKTSTEKHWHVYPCCNAKADEVAHTPGAAATETTPQTCTTCGYVIAPATGHIRHTLTNHPANPATCTAAGNIEYWTCSGCNDKFSDADGTNKITGSVTVAALGHDHSGAWVTTDEDEHWKVCAREGCNEQLDKAVHNPSAWVNVGDGHHHQTCTVCERELTHEVCTFGQPLKYNATSHWEECTKCGNKQNEAAHEFLPDSDKCTGCDYTKSSTITIITPTQPGDSKPAEGNPSTGAVSSPVGYVFVGLAVVGALCLGAKKLTKKHED